jgi:hypothetical protein
MTSSIDLAERSEGDALRHPPRRHRRIHGGADVGRRLRVLAGVDEALIAKIPDERARYTSLGGVVLGTATIAALSMFLAVSQLRGGVGPLALVTALIWGTFVCNLDRWLVSSSGGSRWGRRISVLLPRLIVAVAFGIVIAEPLVLGIFGTAIEQHIKDGRADEIAKVETDLVRCNPVPTTAAPPAGPRWCDDGYRLGGDTPAASSGTLRAKQGRAADLQRVLDVDNKEFARLNDLARAECAGVSLPGTTGEVGYGRQCLDRIRDAETYARTHRIEENTDELAALRAEMATLDTTVERESKNFSDRLSDEIAERQKELRRHQGPIGLLERFDALDEMLQDDLSLQTKRWAIRIFLILVDSLPVVVKFFNGTTAYDRMVEVRKESQQRVFIEEARTGEHEVMVTFEVDRHAATCAARKRREQIDLDARTHAAEINARLDAQIKDLEMRLRGDPPWRPPDDRATANGHREPEPG